MAGALQIGLLTHHSAEQVERMVDYWVDRFICAEDLFVLYGGTREGFAELDLPVKAVFVEDQRLRTQDHQRERQSYRGVYEAFLMATAEDPAEVCLITEFDQIPLVDDLEQRILQRLDEERADALLHGLRRVDGTSHPHVLAHEIRGELSKALAEFSVRRDGVILCAYGFGQVWKRRVLERVLEHPDGEGSFPETYLELWAPSVAHHLGYRLRGLSDQEPFNHYKMTPAPRAEALRSLGAWMAHPYKNFWD